jgi:hypothetical protein
VIAGVHSEVGHVKGELERTVRALTTNAAVRILRRAFEDAGVLPSAAAGGQPRASRANRSDRASGANRANRASRGDSANRLADAVAAEPAESFESLRFRGACELALKMLEQEHCRRRRHASILLGLCAVILLAALGLATSSLVWRDVTTHVGGSLAMLPCGAIALWYAYATRLAERVREDLRRLAKVELRRP